MLTNTLKKPSKYDTEQKVYRAEIWMVKLYETGRSVQSGEHRPFLIISNDVGNKFSPVVFGYPLTSKVNSKKKMPTHVLIESSLEGLTEDSLVLTEQPLTISVDDLKYKICKISEELLQQIEITTLLSFGMLSRYNITLK
jgi:mRNA interferase MazF